VSELTYHTTASDFKVLIEDPLDTALPDFVLDRIDKIWNQEQKILGSALFNGQLMSVLYLDEHVLTGRLVPYKHYMAQMRDPSLQPYLNLLPLGVSARTIAGNSILMGRRSRKVFLDRDKLECVPSGGVDLHARKGDYIDLRQQIEIELHEETGLPASTIRSFYLLGIVKNEGICEICIELVLDPHLEKTDLAINDEYSEFFWLPKEEIDQFKSNRSSEIISVSDWLLSEFN